MKLIFVMLWLYVYSLTLFFPWSDTNIIIKFIRTIIVIGRFGAC